MKTNVENLRLLQQGEEVVVGGVGVGGCGGVGVCG